MLQEVVHFKKQLVRLRRILQETDTLNPFENNNGQFFTTATTTTTSTTTGASSLLLEGGATTGTSVDSKQQENTLIKESGVVALALLEDQRQELADLRRQVVYLQGEITAKDRTIRQQQNLIEKYEAEREKLQAGLPIASDVGPGDSSCGKTIDTISTATQTERLRPLSFGGQEGLASRTEPPSSSQAPVLRNGLRSPAAVNNSHHQHPTINGGNTAITSSSSPSSSALINSSRTSLNLKPKTQISSVYTQLSSIKHSNHNGTPNSAIITMSQKRSSLGSNSNLSIVSSTNANNNSPIKTVRTTHIGNVLTTSKMNQAGITAASSAPTTPPPINNASKLLKSTIRTQVNGGNGIISPVSSTPFKLSAASPNKRSSSIKPPSSFANSAYLDASPNSHKAKSAPSTPMNERIPSSPASQANIQIVIQAADSIEASIKENGCYDQQQNGDDSIVSKGDTNNNATRGSNGKHVDDDDEEPIAESDKDAINNKINSLKLVNGLTGCNDSSCKESSLVI